MITLTVVLRPGAGGPVLDESATAHNVTESGFTLETEAELGANAAILFVLELPDGGRVSGEGRVMSLKKEAFAGWADIRVTRMSWRDRRRLARVLNPDCVDWSKVLSLAIKAVVALTVISAARKLLYQRQDMLALASNLAPKFAALLLMGWSFLGLLRRDKN